MKNALLNRPWIIILGCYLFAMSAWVAMVSIAVHYRQEEVPLTTAAHR